jgi:hypothetical protein
MFQVNYCTIKGLITVFSCNKCAYKMQIANIHVTPRVIAYSIKLNIKIYVGNQVLPVNQSSYLFI